MADPSDAGPDGRAKRSRRELWRADRARYESGSWITEPSLWAIAVYRFGDWLSAGGGGPASSVLTAVYRLAYAAVRLATGIDLPRTAQIGPGLRIWHFGGVMINGDVTIGSHCTLHHGVTIGSAHDGGPVPVVGDNVVIGVNASVLGDISVGDDSLIGAGAVVVSDVPARTTAAGIPARVVRRHE